MMVDRQCRSDWVGFTQFMTTSSPGENTKQHIKSIYVSMQTKEGCSAVHCTQSNATYLG